MPNPQHDSPHDLSVLTTMGIRRERERIHRRDRYAEPGVIDSAAKSRKLSRAGHGVVSANAESAAPDWFRLDAIGIRNPSAIAHEVQASLEPVTAGERQDGVDPIRRQFAKPFERPRPSGVDDRVSAQPTDQCTRPAA